MEFTPEIVKFGFMRWIFEHIDNDKNSMAAAKQLVRYIRPSQLRRIDVANDHFDHFLSILKSDTRLLEKFRKYLLELVADKKCVDAFCDSGILPGTTFLAELYRRVIHKIIPEVYPDNDIRTIISGVFTRKSDVQWLHKISIDKWSELFDLLNFNEEESHEIEYQVANSIVILSHRISSLGLEPEISSKFQDIDKLTSPFITQSAEIIKFIDRIGQEEFDINNNDIDYRQILVLLNQCEEILKDLRNHKNDFGASIPLTYILIRLQQHIRRIRLLLKLLVKDEQLRHEATALLMYEMVKSEHEKNSLFGYVNQNVDLIAYQVAEHGSKSGQHYITETRSEFADLFKASMKGGFIVGFMAFFKVLLSYLKMAPAWHAFSYSLNYAAGFVGMHVTHSALATKQPALTAQSMASVIQKDLYHEKNISGIGEMVARVCRSQLASFAGNLIIVFPMGMLIAFIYKLVWGYNLVTLEKANQLLTEIHPFTSGSIIFASIAGIYLFLTGIVSGYIDNIVIYRQLPFRIRKHFLLNAILPSAIVDKVSVYIENNLGSIMGNIFFGFCMGSTAVIGNFFGIGADVRHITFAAANTGISLVTFQFDVPIEQLLWSLTGVAIIGLFNFMVSFNLAFYVALKARGIVIRDTFKIIGSIWSYLKSNPLAFLIPPG